MLSKKIISTILAVAVGLSTVAVVDVFNAENVQAAGAQDFNSVSTARGYKNTTQHNPMITQKYSADPCAMEYNGRVYVYSTNDGSPQSSVPATNTYSQINQINVMSSADMVNWTDHGSINAAGPNGAAKWAGNSWAPTACHKTINGKEKFFLYFANNANGIGVLTSDSPTGPWVDPIGKPLINRQTPNCGNVTWLFDPAVLVDSDGTGYLYFGGGVPSGQNANPRTARVVKLGANMTSLAGNPQMIDAPYLFEDSGINKVGNTYYYSYCTNWANGFMGSAKIGYMTSNNPMGPFTYKGTCLDNPGAFFGTTGNNHHSIATLNGKSYIFYHAEWLNKQMYGSQKGYRTSHVDSINIGNGSISNAKGTLSGVSQVKDLNPYVNNEAETIAWQGGVTVPNLGNSGNTKVDMNRGDWFGVSQAAFGTGVTSISMRAASPNGATVKVCTGSEKGKVVGYVSIPATGSNNNFKNVSASITGLSGTQNLFFVASGDCSIDNWKFSKSSTPTTEPDNPQPDNPQPDNPDPTPIPGETVKLSDGWYYIKNVNAQKYLQVAGGTGKATANVELGAGTGAKGQQWYLKNLDNGYVTLKSALGDFMVDVAYGKNEDGSNVQIYDGYAGEAQQYVLKSSSTKGAYFIGTKCSNGTKVLDDEKKSTANGANVCQWTYSGNTNQQWIFESIKNSTPTQPSEPSEPSEPSKPSNPITGLKLDYTTNSWGSGYQVNFKITNNTSADVNTWTLKLKKSDINISTSWNIKVKEDGDYYVITPVEWNSKIAKGSSIEFGTQGTGKIGSTLNYTLK